MTPGRIDVHSHLLPNVDDGCGSQAETLECARQLVDAGYTHSFCTPHYWPNLKTDSTTAPEWTRDLQDLLERAGVPLKVYPGGEINLRPGLDQVDPAHVVSYGMGRKYALVDLWADRLPDFFEPQVRWLQSLGMRVILAHPERMRAVQSDPGLADHFAELGLLMQGNLQCLGDPEGAATRVTAEQYLLEGRYFMLGTDLHNVRTLDVRFRGLKRAIELVGDETVGRLTRENPKRIVLESGLTL